MLRNNAKILRNKNSNFFKCLNKFFKYPLIFIVYSGKQSDLFRISLKIEDLIKDY
jgi:hypothetical protein